jgi:transketolase
LRVDWEQKEAAKQAKAAAAPAPVPTVKKDKIQSGLAQGAIKAARAGYPVYSISSDVPGSTGMSTFQKSFPDRFVDVGIAEANMVSTAAGFAKAGYIPVVDTFGQFGVTKGNLPLTMAALSQAPVIAVFSHVGFQDAADGASHQATTYFAATSSIPHTVVVAPSCANEAESLMFQAVQRLAEARGRGEDGQSVVFFVGREGYPVYWVEGAAYEWGKAQLLSQGQDVTIIACGPLLGKAVAAGRLLKEKGLSANVISNPFINQVDLATIGAAVQATGGRVITIEDHQLIGGMGSLVAHALGQAGIGFTRNTARPPPNSWKPPRRCYSDSAQVIGLADDFHGGDDVHQGMHHNGRIQRARFPTRIAQKQSADKNAEHAIKVVLGVNRRPDERAGHNGARWADR